MKDIFPILHDVLVLLMLYIIMLALTGQVWLADCFKKYLVQFLGVYNDFADLIDIL